MSFPNLSSLTQSKRPRDEPEEIYHQKTLAFYDVSESHEFSGMEKHILDAPNLSHEERQTLAHAINRQGVKTLIMMFLKSANGSHLREDDILLNATRWWWRERDFSKLPSPLPWWTEDYNQEYNSRLLKRDDEGYVTVDLWHAARGYNVYTDAGTLEFKKFKNKPAFFFGSFGDVLHHLDDIESYTGEGEPGENEKIYVKRGRFRFKPLLWFDDVSAKSLLEDEKKLDVITQLLTHQLREHQESEAEISIKPSKLSRMLYQRRLNTETGEAMNHYYQPSSEVSELRLDNNCAYQSTKVKELYGFQGTLAVDLSGFAGMTTIGSTQAISSECVVLWDIEHTLKQEWPWELLHIPEY